MPKASEVLNEMSPTETPNSHLSESKNEKSWLPGRQIIWKNVIIYCVLHVFALTGIYNCGSFVQLVYLFIISYVSMLGISAGVHRLWSHRSYKAKLPLRIFLMLMNCSVLQKDIYVWSRDHRVHHKFSDTDADPYNVSRGIFFSHIGWSMVKKHPAVLEKGKAIDCSDVLADPVVRFQMKHYVPLGIIMAVIAPSLIPYFVWDVSAFQCFCLYFAFRYAYVLHLTGFFNSIGHTWGNKPYNPNIRPAESLILILLANGEGYHNYHHTFPWDYSSSELGWRMNPTTMFIDIMAWLGLAYDRKQAPKALVETVKRKYSSNEVKENGCESK